MVRMIAHNLSREVSQNPRIRAALEICRTLRTQGFEAWWVGGCVRDSILEPQQTPSDIDIATNASFAHVKNIFPDVIAIGRAFGVGLLRHSGFNFEIATFRKESDYKDRRHPSQVGPGSMQEDSQRRDFTINALYYDPLSHTIADFHGGLDDLQRRLLRCVGDARERMYEDPLRIFRLFRFASNLNLTIESSAKEAAQQLVSELNFVSKERFLLEISKLNPGALGTFAHLAQHALSELTRLPLPKDEGFSSNLELPKDAFRFPGTVLALMCYHQSSSFKVDWVAPLSDWPLTLEDKSHIEFIKKVSTEWFSIPSPHQESSKFLTDIRWLSKQNRIKVADADWIFKSITAKSDEKNCFLKLLLPLMNRSEPQLSIGQAFTSLASERAKPLRKELQLWAKEQSPEALGWARLITEVIVLLNLSGVAIESRPLELQIAEKGQLEPVYKLAEKMTELHKKQRR